MTLFEYYLQYMTELYEGRRSAPEGITLTATDEQERMAQLSSQLSEMGVAAFVRACAEQDGTKLPEELFTGDDGMGDFASMLKNAQNAPQETPQPEEKSDEPDPDAGKHAFEVFLDCVAMDDGLVQYLVEVLKSKDWKEFFKLSQITTKLDLDPREFLYWLGHREDFGTDEEKACAVIMDGCMERLLREERLDVLAALLSGDKATFETFRCEAPELKQLPEATFAWYCRNYLDRDYPIRVLLKVNGVEFPAEKE